MATPAKHKPSVEPPPPRIKCSYAGCNFFFQTDKDMKKHKATFPEHDYCNKCDIDFETEEHLLIHKIKSKKHIVCPICNIDFGSEGGRDRHIRQFHRTTQNLTCNGCTDTFRSAAGLMRHIENGECHEIPANRLLAEQQKKLLRKEVFEFSAPPVTPSLVDADEDEDGGVQLHMNRSEMNREAMANQPGNLMDQNNNDDNLIDRHWPKLGLGKTGLEDAMGELMNFSTASAQSGNKENERNKENVGWSDRGHDHVFPGSASALGSASESAAGTASLIEGETLSGTGTGTGTGSTLGPPAPFRASNMGMLLSQIYQDWNPNNYLDELTGEYVCACGKRCGTKDGFEKHVLAKSKGSRRMLCPGCFKTFKSTAAIIAHWESPSLKCNLSEENLYAQIMDEVSGGMIQINGYNEDGTLKYEAGKLELRKTTTVGVDLEKVRW
ncbi:putative C2H2 finger domain protein [Aspergillus mulundensis]|uniref:C2H2-type domain-containing protein n=1 Tax=Aspergillus mulundensis TaxID=1810919 RepID=A0A3D8RYY5_9EURO|nr:hypothetical protein DSM5745_06097 [Aspergillus mulundensis]RDW79245.1 hypothetical protein DSM5745_06097 [Aspergillus mulundensis]